MAVHKPKFEMGEIVQHRLFGYRGVIIGVHREGKRGAQRDPWQPPAERGAWYELLVHDTPVQETRVPERELVRDRTGTPISNPSLRNFFREFDGERYRVGGMVH